MLFAEIEIPETKGNILKMRLKIWLAMLRIMLFFRIGRHSQVLTDAKQRAEDAAV